MVGGRWAEMYPLLTSTVVLKRKQEMPYVPLQFDNNLTIDALVDLRAFFSAISQNESDIRKQEPPNNIFKIDGTLTF